MKFLLYIYVLTYQAILHIINMILHCITFLTAKLCNIALYYITRLIILQVLTAGFMRFELLSKLTRCLFCFNSPHSLHIQILHQLLTSLQKVKSKHINLYVSITV